MKDPIEWIREHLVGHTHGREHFNTSNITIEDVIALQDDARKDGLMTAELIASEVINRESPKYARPDDRGPAVFTLSGLNYFVSSAITSEADKLRYLPGAKRIAEVPPYPPVKKGPSCKPEGSESFCPECGMRHPGHRLNCKSSNKRAAKYQRGLEAKAKRKKD